MINQKRGIAVGLTGNISSGKTTVLNVFEKLGCMTLSLDELAHDLLYNLEVKKKIIDTFGEEITDEKGSIKRSSLAKIIFNDDKKRRDLESILHPEVKRAGNLKIESIPEGATMIIEAPLLFETGWDAKVDYTIMITCPEDIRCARFCAVGPRECSEFQKRDKAQWSESRKVDLANFVIDNSKDLTKIVSQATHIMKEIRAKNN